MGNCKNCEGDDWVEQTAGSETQTVTSEEARRAAASAAAEVNLVWEEIQKARRTFCWPEALPANCSMTQEGKAGLS